ncbi:hypothetical protein SAY87_005911 [Trapa incisa]|uniref:NmrA-like domain-containing protein n=1 Tax=Trapa incisa TaxID=236973 RepID=A0AAN7KAN8_9MYRT|nr:hypothetical protein SAY87_005911 [Trapa incisa]
MANSGDKTDKILIFGASGYLGKYMVRASTCMGHPTYAYVRPIGIGTASDPWKHLLLQEFESMNVTVVQGGLEDEEKLKSVLRISNSSRSSEPSVKWHHKGMLIRCKTRASRPYPTRANLSSLGFARVRARIRVPTAFLLIIYVKTRFIPSEYGNEVDRVSRLPPYEALLENKRVIRRAIEAAKIPFTIVCENWDEVTVYGSGEVKVVLNFEEDVAIYTVKVTTDTRAANRVVTCRSVRNIASQLDLITWWEERVGRTLKRVHIPDEEIVKMAEALPFPDNIPVAIIHSIFIKGDKMSFDLMEDDL